MKIRPKKIWTMRLDGDCKSATRTDVSARGISVTIDEPLDRGGTNIGLMPVETLMAALAGCTNVITHKIARANDIEIRDMSVRVDATMDSIGTALVREIDTPFPDVTIHIAITTPADEAKLAVLKTDLPRFCAVSKVLRQAGTKVTEVWTVNRE